MTIPPRHILVTGSTRSGTTFLGKMLALPSEVGYVQEPFNCRRGLASVEEYFLYLYDGMPSEEAQRSMVAALLEGRGSFRRLPILEGPSLSRKVGRLLGKSESNLVYLWTRVNPRVKRLLLKDPFACLASEYLHRHFGVSVIVLMRHPAAFVTSMLRLGHPSHLTDLLDQPALVEHHLQDVRRNVSTNDLTMVEQLATVWLCLYGVLQTFSARNPGMILLRHEDLSVDPEDVISSLYCQLDLPFTSKIRQTVREHTRSDNPVDPTANQPHVLKRNSQENAVRWKGILSGKDVDTIRGITSPIARDYYADDSWSPDVP